MKLVKSLLLPYFKRFWLMLLSVILVGAFGCGILIGLRNAYHSLNTNVNALIDECGYPDLYVQTTSNIDASYLTYLPDNYNEKMGIEKAEYRSTHTTTFTYGDMSYSARLISYDENSFLKHHVINGTLSKDSVRMEYYFAKSNGFKVGDTIKAKMPDGSNLEYTIDATIVSPEASVVKADPYSISSSRDFAYIYVPKSTIDEHSSSLYFNEILYQYKPDQKKNLEETVDALKEYIKEETGIEITEEMVKQLESNVAFATTYDESEAIKFYKDALSAVNLITLLAPAVFFVVVLIVTALFLFQIVKQCRKDIGIMRALGEKISSISLVFLSLGFAVGFLSWLVGIGIGSIFTVLANGAYGSALKLFPQPFIMHPIAIFISLGIVVTVTLLTAFFASLSISKIKPVEAMKALPPTNNNTPLLTRTVFKKAPISLKVTISQTLRNLRRYIVSGICLLSSGVLVFVALSIGESKNTMMTQLFETRINYDVQVYFDNQPSEEIINYTFPSDDSNIIAKTYIKYLPSEMVNTSNNKRITALINGIKDDQDLIRVVDNYQHVISIPENGIVLSSYHAQQLDAKVGDVITANEVELTVSSISNQYLYQVSYTNFDDYSPTYARGSLLLKVKDQDAFFKEYKDKNHVTYISYTNVIKGEFNDRLAAFEISSRILTVMAIIIGFMIVFNMMQTNLKEQKRTFATMRTLGYQRSAISNANLIMSIIQFIFAMVFATPIGILLSKGLLRSISTNSQIHPYPRTWTMYVFSFVLVFGFLLVSHFLVMNTMKKWNLPESVKERE
jgi:putative ABC transport system permease protein